MKFEIQSLQQDNVQDWEMFLVLSKNTSAHITTASELTLTLLLTVLLFFSVMFSLFFVNTFIVFAGSQAHVLLSESQGEDMCHRHSFAFICVF